MLKKAKNSDEIVQSSLSELTLFLLFFFLILLGSILTTAEQKSAAETDQYGNSPNRTQPENQHSGLADEVEKWKEKAGYEKSKSEHWQRRAGIAEKKLKNVGTNIIILADNDGFQFATGSAELSIEFRNKLENEIIPNIDALITKRDKNISHIEIVGHTDQQKFRDDEHQPISNLDTLLIPKFYGESYYENFPSPLQASDNVGLGMARAMSVLLFLRDKSELIGRYNLVPYSAGHLIDTNNSVSEYLNTNLDEAHRRRVEIRLRGTN